MRLTSRHAIFSSLVLAAGLAACSSGGDPVPEQASATDDVVSEPTETLPEPIEAAVAEPAAEPLCPSEPGVFCRGPLLVRVSDMSLSPDGSARGDGSRDLVLSVSYSVENLTDTPLKFNMLSREVTRAQLANGVVLSGNFHRSVSGITPCSDNPDTCRTGQAADFVTIAPGESPAAFSVRYFGKASGDEMPGVPRVATAEANVQLVTIEADGTSRNVQATFQQVPLFNNLAS